MPMPKTPVTFSQAIADTICERLAMGESLRAICRTSKMPTETAVRKWAIKDDKFGSQYTRAREAQAEFWANEIIEIADEIPVCSVPDPDGGTSERIDAAGVQRNKLRVDARKWIACKLLPKKYGDRIEQNISGEIGIKRVIADI